jgi:tRNA pseudouridine13 synthase
MLPLVTADLPGCEARCSAKERSAEEVLAKQPAGTGPFYWLKVEKDGLSTQQTRAAIARSVNLATELVGFAGNRDRQGRCIQWFSVPSDPVDHPGPLRRAGTQGKMKVLELTSSHKPVTAEVIERLRWRLVLNGAVAADGYRRARAVMDRLRKLGCANYFPIARFGDEGSLAKWGRMLLAGKRLPGAVKAAGIDESRCLRACQEQLFDRYLSARVSDGLLATCISGDVLRTAQGGDGLVSDPAHAQKRLDSFEAVPLGPLFGAGMLPAAGDAAAREAAVLASGTLEPAALSQLRGDRRAIRVQPAKVTVDIVGGDVVVSCELPVDTYVTVLIDELLKPERPSE